MTSLPPLAPLAPRAAFVAPAVLLLLVALAPAPLFVFTDFDVPKRLVLASGAFLMWAGTVFVQFAGRTAFGRRETALGLPLPFALALALSLAAFGFALGGGARDGAVTALAAVSAGLFVAQMSDGTRAVRWIARGAAAAAALTGAYGLAQLGGWDWTAWADRRVPVSTFGNTSFAAEFQAAALPLSLLLAFRAGRAADKRLGLAGAVLGGVHLLVCTSRTDYAAAAAGLLAAAVLLLHGSRRKRAAGVLGAGGLVAGLLLVVAFLSGWSVLGRSDTLAVRRHIWGSTAEMIGDAPFRLPGQAFIDLYPAVRTPDEFQLSLGRTVATPHNDLLEITATQGVHTGALALLVVGLLVLSAGRGARDTLPMRAALLGSLAASAISALGSSPLAHPTTALLPALVAGGLASIDTRGRTLRMPGIQTTIGLALLLFPAMVMSIGQVRSDAFLLLGREALRDGKPKEALVLLDTASAADGRAFTPRYELGTILRRTEPARAAVALRVASEIRPGSLLCRESYAYALRNDGRPIDALEVLDDALDICPWHPKLLAARGGLHLSADRLDAALADLERAVPLLPGDQRLRSRAMLAEARAAKDPSEATFRDALDVLEELFAAGELDAFTGFLSAMLDRDRRLLLPLVVRARRIVEERPEVAVALIRVATEAAKEDAGFLEDGARVLASAGRADLARRLHGRIWALKGERALAEGRYEEAQRCAVEAVVRSEVTRHYLLSARALARLGQTRDAIEAVAKALAAGNFDPIAVRDDPAFESLLHEERFRDLIIRAARRLR